MPWVVTPTLEDEIKSMQEWQILDAIGEIVGSISAELPWGMTPARVQRDALAKAYSMHLGDEEPSDILIHLMDKFEGFPVVEWWRKRILTE